MLQNYSRYRILQEFFDFPRKSFYMREVSRRMKIGQASVIDHLKALVKHGLIIKEKRGLYPCYRANRDGSEFKILKKQNLVWRLSRSSLIEYIDERMKPNCIVLFGSASRGEDTEKSDMDLFIQAEEARLDLGKYERLLNRRINILFEPDIKGISKELLNNIINGEVLYGYLKVF